MSELVAGELEGVQGGQGGQEAERPAGAQSPSETASASGAEGLPAPGPCPNCGAVFATAPRLRHCPECGQAVHIHPPSLGEFLHEFVSHYVAIEGALWRTLRDLVFRPGALTLAYLQGRRRQYVLPLRLFLSASFVFFLLAKVLGFGHTFDVQDVGRPDIPAELAACQSEARACDATELAVLKKLASEGGVQTVLKQAGVSGLSVAPYVTLAMLPFHALLLQWAYRKRRQPYGAHFVLSLHLHSLWFLVFAALAWLPIQDWAGPVLTGLLAHSLFALKRVYGGRWLHTVLRAGFVSALYFLLTGFVAVGVGYGIYRSLG